MQPRCADIDSPRMKADGLPALWAPGGKQRQPAYKGWWVRAAG